MENTITENDMDAASSQFVRGLDNGTTHREPDLDVDGFSESILARLIRLFSSSKS